MLKFILSFIPTPLPVGREQFEKWADSIIALSGQFADRDSMHFAMCSMIVHLPPDRGYVAKREFVKALRKAAANQVASAVFQEIKLKNTPAPVEDTTAAPPQVESSNGKEPEQQPKV